MTWTEWKQVEGFTFDDLIYEKKSIIESGAHAARITINRPHVHNAVTDHTGEEMRYAFDDASRDPMVGIVVLTGAGDRAFCSGGDVKWEAGENYGIGFSYGSSMQKMLRLCRVPVLAAVKGYAIGGGNHLAYMCDFTIAADNAIFGQVGPRVGSPADGYYVSYLTHVVGHKKAREMWMLCRRYNAQQGLEMGLANTVVPLAEFDEAVDSWCEEVLALSPTCIEILKATFDNEAYRYEGHFGINQRQLYPDYFDGPEVKEAQAAFFEKRQPNFWQYRKPKPKA